MFLPTSFPNQSFTGKYTDIAKLGDTSLESQSISEEIHSRRFPELLTTEEEEETIFWWLVNGLQDVDRC